MSNALKLSQLVPVPSGVLKGQSGDAVAAVAGTDYQAPIGTISGLVKGNGANALAAAVSGTDIKTVNGTSLIGSGDVPVATTGKAIAMAIVFG